MTASTGRSQRILVASVGSYGDVFPFLELGVALQNRGHQVTILTSGYFGDLVERAGLQIAPVGTAEQYREYITNPDLLHPFRGLMLTRRMLTSIIEPIYDYIRENWQGDNVLIASSPYCMATRIAEERLRIPLVTVCPAPIAMGSQIDPPAVSPQLSPERVPRPFRRLFGKSVNWVTDQLFGSRVNAFRKTLGLRPMRSLMRWWHASRGTIAWFPEWFAPASRDWPANHQFAGFPVCMPTSLPDANQQAANSQLESWLKGPKKPLLFYPGSNASRLQKYFEVCAGVCQRLDRRGIFVAPAAVDLQHAHSSHMLVLPFVSMSQTLPHVEAAIHHGGVGTIAACLHAGVPQLIRPIFSDQPDNARHIARIGVGSWLPDSRFQINPVTQAIQRLIDEPCVAQMCQKYRQHMLAENGLSTAADLVESMIGRSLSRFEVATCSPSDS